MSAFFDALIFFLKSLGTFILDGALIIIKSAFYFIVDGFLTCISTLLSAVDLASLGTSTLMQWGNVPSQLIYLINAAGIPAGLTIIVSAKLIRMALNLIPAAFTRI